MNCRDDCAQHCSHQGSSKGASALMDSPGSVASCLTVYLNPKTVEHDYSAHGRGKLPI
ncbi:MAG: hypothetical protein IIA11_00010 [Proteobacteria bacterium]|nr:hypothetical protein [Pseudomonadota bacterium]